MKSGLLNVLKLTVAGILVYWMWYSGKLDFRQLTLLWENPLALLACCGVWLVASVLIGSWRWSLLLTGIGLSVPYLRVVQLHLIGLFFNSTMPGAVGGDIIKAVYVMRDHQAQEKTPAMLTILLDRVIGLLGLFSMCAVFMSFNLSRLLEIKAMVPVVFIVYSVFAFTIIFYMLLFRKSRDQTDFVAIFLQKPIFGFSILFKIYSAVRTYKECPWVLVKALGLSMIIQISIMFIYIFLTELINQQPVDLFDFAAIFPVGVLLTALPLAPGGMGVGHVAFDNLYQFIGIANGANVFNIFLITQIAMNLFGVFPYLLFKKKVHEN